MYTCGNCSVIYSTNFPYSFIMICSLLSGRGVWTNAYRILSVIILRPCFALMTQVASSPSVVTVGLVASCFVIYSLCTLPLAHAYALILPSHFSLRKIKLFIALYFSCLVILSGDIGSNTPRLCS